MRQPEPVTICQVLSKSHKLYIYNYGNFIPLEKIIVRISRNIPPSVPMRRGDTSLGQG